MILPIGGTVALQCDCELHSWNVNRRLARGADRDQMTELSCVRRSGTHTSTTERTYSVL